MRVFVVSPYHGGSHAAWAEGWARHSSHELHLLTMDARFWKWRMFGAATTLALEAERLVGEFGPPDAVVATDMLDLPGFLGRARRVLGDPVSILYMHENQLTYPLAEGAAEDLTYAFINWQSMEAADATWWNSAFHRDEVLRSLPVLLGRFPDHRHGDLLAAVADRMEVMPVGVEVDDLPMGPKDGPPVILWNHRWEYDKDPAAFLAALEAVDDLEWGLALCGERFATLPSELDVVVDRFSERLVHDGYADRATYASLLGRSLVAVSTARQEFFGISVVEAAAAGAAVLLPDRLAYPEVIPDAFHPDVLYTDEHDLAHRLRGLLVDAVETAQGARTLAEEVRSRYGWASLAPSYDEALAEIVAGRNP
ncbi:MAG: DUF3524 domain-containing protein [Acidimicrobiia bacterium]|nr:DUF3524 domain-containing protein [Acidimicrobiia bacterium]